MRLNDTAAGLIAAVCGVLVLVQAQTFPPMPGQPIGPGLFPMVVGAALLMAGGVLAMSRGSRREPLVRADPWVRKPAMVLNFALVVAMLLFYAIVLQRVGFFLTAFLFLSVLFVAFGVTRRWIAPVAAVTVVLIHYGFYTLLRVPLPWGVFESIAW